MKTATKQVISKQSRLTEALLKGQQLTEKQIAARFKLANPRATISDIRRTGVTINAVTTVTSKGQSVTRYAVAQ